LWEKGRAYPASRPHGQDRKEDGAIRPSICSGASALADISLCLVTSFFTSVDEPVFAEFEVFMVRSLEAFLQSPLLYIPRFTRRIDTL
jgi:hypothetical protein